MADSSAMNVSVAVIGGGIGGLATTVALNQAGIDAHVFEQTAAYGDVGGHLTIDDAAIAELAAMGLEDAFRAMSCPLNGIELKNLGTGEVMAHFPHPDLAALGVDDDSRTGDRVVYAFQRADFLEMLVNAIPAENVHTGHRLTSLSGDADSATASFENGAEVTAQVIIAADGVRSQARASFDDSAAVPANWTILRTLCPADVLPADLPNDRMRFWNGAEFGEPPANMTHLLTVPVRGNDFISLDLQFVGGDQLEDCNARDLPIDRVMARYPEGMDPIVKAMIDARIEPIAAYPIHDRPVAEKWVENRIAILGDAAHSMRPSLGQGACQSLHDAGQITKSIGEHGLTNAALDHYEGIRKPYVKMIVEAAKKAPMGPPKK